MQVISLTLFAIFMTASCGARIAIERKVFCAALRNQVTYGIPISAIDLALSQKLCGDIDNSEPSDIVSEEIIWRESQTWDNFAGHDLTPIEVGSGEKLE